MSTDQIYIIVAGITIAICVSAGFKAAGKIWSAESRKAKERDE
jgi:hypothetical protein